MGEVFYSPLREVDEGFEDETFKAIFGDETTDMKAVPLMKKSRLFQCSEATGAFTVREVEKFTPADLIPGTLSFHCSAVLTHLTSEDVYILDTFTNVFLWIGAKAGLQKVQQGSWIQSNCCT